MKLHLNKNITSCHLISLFKEMSSAYHLNIILGSNGRVMYRNLQFKELKLKYLSFYVKISNTVS